MTKKELILNHLLLSIQSKRIKIGHKISSERAIASKFKCNRHTANKAISELSRMGFIKNVQGDGMYLLSNFSEKLNPKNYCNYNRVFVKEASYETIPLSFISSSFGKNEIVFSIEFFKGESLVGKSYIFIKNINLYLKEYLFDQDIPKFFFNFGISIFDVYQKYSYSKNNKYPDIKDKQLIIMENNLLDITKDLVATTFLIIGAKYVSINNLENKL